MTLERGTLIVRDKKGGGQLILVRIGEKPAMNVAQGEVSQSLLDQLSRFHDKEVEFERINGQPKRVREPGGVFVAPSAPTRAGASDSARRNGPWNFHQGSRQPFSGQLRPAQRGRAVPRVAGDFHNPYNFVPAPPRNTSHPELGDHAPVAQDVFDRNRYTGVIRVRMVAKTPLLVPDTSVDAPENLHKISPLRLGADGKPLIPASSVRGMLRSAYEAVTNSRFGRFSHSEHRDRLAFRMDARDGLRLIPARVENGKIQLLTGTSGVGQNGGPNGPMYAAWLPRYHKGQIASYAVCYPDNTLPAHGDEVVCWVERVQHSKGFEFWRVREIVRGGDPNALGRQPTASPPRGTTAPAHPTDMRRIHGWVCVTNANINRKHDERVFFIVSNSSPPGPFAVTDTHRAMWRELIANYQAIHKDELDKRRQRNEEPCVYYGPEPGRTAWSRHVYTREDRELRDGTLCYVRLNQDRSDVEAIFPVMIARELYEKSPWDLLPLSLRPASNINELSPADRVFGWVHADADRKTLSRGDRAAARGLLRVGPVTCESSVNASVMKFDEPGVPLAILSNPKPQQGRFYVAASPNGEAQRSGLTKATAGYSIGKGLRGRKVYPHQRNLPTGHWSDPMQDRTQQPVDGHYQEYRRPTKNGVEQRDAQNRSILGWVKPGAEFTFDIHVHNLSKVELGALFWLLQLPDDHFFRFGGGKPLGFGSVRLTIDSCDVRTGAGLASRYASWCEEASPADPSGEAMRAFEAAVVEAYEPLEGTEFERVPFIQAFKVACTGHRDRLPVHYPRTSVAPNPDGESFKWFVANEDGARHALPDIVYDSGLPLLSNQRPGRGGRR